MRLKYKSFFLEMSNEILLPWVNNAPLFCYHLHALGEYFISFHIQLLHCICL